MVAHLAMVRRGLWGRQKWTHECGADPAFFLGAQVWLSKLLPIAV